MDWRTPTLADAAILQECALNNNFFANNYGAVNSILYEKKFHSQISIEGEWIYEKFFEDEKAYFSFPHNINGKLDDAKKAVEKQNAILELLKNKVGQSEERIEYLTSLNTLLQAAIKDLKHDLA